MLYINDEVSRWIHCHLLKLISKFFERWTTAGIQHPTYTTYTYIKSVSKKVCAYDTNPRGENKRSVKKKS